jgi:hypothetical protein
MSRARGPIGRPVASSTPVQMASTGTSSGGRSRTNGALKPRPPYARSTSQLDQLASGLTQRDWMVLQRVAESRLLTGAQLQRLYWHEGKQAARGRLARRALQRLTEHRLLVRLDRRVGGVRAGSSGFVYGIGPVGERLLRRRAGASVRRRFQHLPGARFVAHILAVSELLVAISEAERDGRTDVLVMESEPACWRPFVGRGGGRIVLKPDCFLRLGTGAFEDSWFCEMDLATESPTTVLRKAQVYVAFYRNGTEQAARGVFPKVLWIVPDDRRLEVVTNALERLPEGAQRLFEVTTRPDALWVLVGARTS